MKDKKNLLRLKNIIMLLCMIPYIFLIVMCIKSAIFGYDNDGGSVVYYGFIAMAEYAIHFITNIFDWCFDTLNLCVFFAWVAYQMFYFITFKKKDKGNKDDEQNANGEDIDTNVKKVKKVGARKIVFFISIGCWAMYLLTSIGAIFFGSIVFFGSDRVYGIEGMINALIVNGLTFIVIPVLPCSLIYVIIYLIANRKNIKKSKEVKEEIKENIQEETKNDQE